MAIQRLTGTHVDGEGVPLEGISITAKPLPNQVINSETLSTAVVPALKTTTDVNGDWYFDLIQSASYKITIKGWGSSTITITDDSTLDFSIYLTTTVAVPTILSGILCTTGEYAIPTIITINNQDGTFSKEIQWNIVE